MAKFHLRAITCAACALILGLATSYEMPSRAEDVQARCQGSDMLAEMQQRSPDLYKKVMEEGQRLPNAQAELWKIEKPGLASSYLLGTMHLSDPRIAVLSLQARQAIADAKSVTVEVADLSEAALAKAISKSANLIMYTDGRSLAGQLSQDDYRKVQEIVGKSGLPGEVSALLKPWLISMLLATSDCERQKVAAGAPVLDFEVAAEGRKHGLTVSGFETADDQLAALAAVPDDQQIAMLKVGLKYADRANDMMETLVQMYLKRQIGAAMPFQLALAEEAGASASAFEGFKTVLLVERNARMAKAAEPMLEKGNAFIAVGALHLPGDTGLVALLRQRGYTVTPIE